MTADPAPPLELPLMRAELGKGGTTTVTIDNPLSTPVVLSASSSTPRTFGVTPQLLQLAPYGSTELAVEYSPGTLDHEEEAVLVVEGEGFGRCEYHVSVCACMHACVSGRAGAPLGMPPGHSSGWCG